jgi:excisionase family DNA binding protein
LLTSSRDGRQRSESDWVKESEMPQELLLLDEVARECRTTIGTVRHWVATGRLKSVRPGRRRLVRRTDLDRFLESTPGASHPDNERQGEP